MYASMHTHTHTHTQCNILSFSHQYRAIICFIISKVYLYNDTQLVPTNLTNVLHFISSKFVGYGQHRIIDIYTQLYIYTPTTIHGLSRLSRIALSLWRGNPRTQYSAAKNFASSLANRGAIFRSRSPRTWSRWSGNWRQKSRMTTCLPPPLAAPSRSCSDAILGHQCCPAPAQHWTPLG